MSCIVVNELFRLVVNEDIQSQTTKIVFGCERSADG